jgi:hypothetical protein
MTRKGIVFAAGLTLLGLLLFGHGCSPSWAGDWDERCVGKGPITTQNRTVGNFTSITIASAVDVQLTRGQTTSVRLEAPRDALPVIETRVEQGRLIIDSRGCINAGSRRPIRAFITYRELGEIDLRGSGNVTANGTIQRDRLEITIHGSGDLSAAVAVRQLELEIFGSGDVFLSGQTGSGEIELAGSGDIKASKLRSTSARVQVNGSGDVDLTVTGELDAVVNGSGDIVYRGNPKKVRQRVHGSGSIEGA